MTSLRARLLLAYAGLILAGFTAVALLAGRQISAGTVQDFAGGLAEQARLVARALKEPVEEGNEHGVSDAGLNAILRTYADQVGADLLLVDGSGRYWAASSEALVDTSTSVLAAALAGRVSSDTQGNTALAAAPILEDGRVLGAVQLAAPLAGAQRLVWDRWLALGGAVAAVTAAAGVAAFLLATTLTRPLAQLQQAALDVARGDLTRRLPETRRDEIGQVARAFNHMASQVEAMVEEQRAFASNASHELRTPLTTIRLRSEALREGGLDPKTARQYVAELDDEVQRLGHLVQELMMLSRLDSGRLEAGRERIDPVRLARQLLAEIQPLADSRAITLELSTPATLPTVTAGSTHLAIVFRNLLQNALKYTPDGGAIRWRMAAEGGAIHHTIRDTGLGIAAEDLPRVFDRFFRVDRARSRAAPGTGLGLSLVRMIVTFYGGTVRLESAGIGQGTAAHVVWPLSDPTEAAPAGEA